MSGDANITRVNNDSSEQINEHGICWVVENDSGKDIPVFHKTEPEWQAFIDNLPTGVTLSACTVGVLYDQGEEEDRWEEGLSNGTIVATKETAHLDIRGRAPEFQDGVGTFLTKAKYNLTGVNNIKASWFSGIKATQYIGIGDSDDLDLRNPSVWEARFAGSFNTEPIEENYDISSINGEWYIYFGIVTDEDDFGAAELHQLFLEE